MAGVLHRSNFARCFLASYIPRCQLSYIEVGPDFPPKLPETFRRNRPKAPADAIFDRDVNPVNVIDGEAIDIGFRPAVRSRSERMETLKERKSIIKQNLVNTGLEQAARLRTLSIPLDEVKSDWCKSAAARHTQIIANHYGIYKHLFEGATYLPLTHMNIQYSGHSENTSVCRGNSITPLTAFQSPSVSYEATSDGIYTLILTSPDGHLTDDNSEYLHWFIGNISGSDINSGDVYCDYLPPFPAKGTGFHRHVFILYEQERHLAYTEQQRQTPCLNLKKRTFKNVEFYRRYQNDITPVGLSFFQSQWDESVSNVFHNILKMKEPVFEYEGEKLHVNPQVKWPHREPITYLDRYMEST